MTSSENRRVDLDIQEQSIQERVDELIGINEVLGRSIRNLIDLDDLDGFLKEILKSCADVAGAAAVALFRYDKMSDSAAMEFWLEDGQFIDPESIPVFRRPFFSNVSRTDALRIIQSWWISVEDLGLPADVREWHRRRGHRMMIHFPLKRGEERLGFIGLVFRAGFTPTSSQVEILSALAQQATLALETKRLSGEARQAAIQTERAEVARRRAAALALANQAMRNSLDRLAEQPHIDGFLGDVLSACVGQFSAAGASVSIYDPESTQNRPYLIYENGTVKRAADSDHPDVRGGRLPLYSAADRGEVIVRDAQAIAALPEDDWLPLLVAGGPFRTLISIPLFFGAEFRGSFSFGFRTDRVFSEDERELVQAFAHQSILALELTRLGDKAREAARHSAIAEERSRMARELHDTLAQTFTGVVVQLAAARDLLDGTEERKALFHVHRAQDLAREGLAEARRAIHALSPALLDAGDLSTAIECLIARITDGTSTRGIVNIPNKLPLLPAETSSHLLRIVQEALSNSMRHGKPGKIEVSVYIERSELWLVVRDDGAGCERTHLALGLGLTSMTERARHLGGTLELVSSPGNGATVTAILPIHADEPQI